MVKEKAGKGCECFWFRRQAANKEFLIIVSFNLKSLPTAIISWEGL